MPMIISFIGAEFTLKGNGDHQSLIADNPGVGAIKVNQSRGKLDALLAHHLAGQVLDHGIARQTLQQMVFQPGLHQPTQSQLNQQSGQETENQDKDHR